MSLTFGAAAWFFFIQSPVLYKLMVRERFVPVQMRLSRILFTTLFISTLVTVVAAAVSSATVISPATLTAFAALLAVTVNKFVVFPKALRAGGESHKLREAQGETGTAVEFVSDGAGDSATRMHRVVVVFVLLMVAGLVAHGALLVT